MQNQFDPIEYRRNEAAREVTTRGEKFDRAQVEVASQRQGFFDRLAILSGSAIALSITFLGYLGSPGHLGIVGRPILYFAWFLLLGSLIASVLRNFRNQAHFYFVHASPYLIARGKKIALDVEAAESPSSPLVAESFQPMSAEDKRAFLGNLQTKAERLENEGAKAQRKSESAFLFCRVCENVALLGFFMGLTLLVIFAVQNTPA